MYIYFPSYYYNILLQYTLYYVHCEGEEKTEMKTRLVFGPRGAPATVYIYVCVFRTRAIYAHTLLYTQRRACGHFTQHGAHPPAGDNNIIYTRVLQRPFGGRVPIIGAFTRPSTIFFGIMNEKKTLQSIPSATAVPCVRAPGRCTRTVVYARSRPPRLVRRWCGADRVRQFRRGGTAAASATDIIYQGALVVSLAVLSARAPVTLQTSGRCSRIAPPPPHDLLFVRFFFFYRSFYTYTQTPDKIYRHLVSRRSFL